MEDSEFEVIIMASGSEVEIAVDAKAILNEKGIRVRIVSMPSKEIFEMQSIQYKEKILPRANQVRIFIEAGVSQLPRNYTGEKGAVIGIDTFGASAPYNILFEEYGLTAKNVVKTTLEIIKKNKM
jgi:transketolase